MLSSILLPDGNNIRVTGLGGSTELIADVPGPFLLNDDRFHATRIILRGNGAGGSTLTLILIEDIDGVSGDPIEHELITEAVVAGFDPATFEGRLIAGGRTGGAFTLTWLDRLRLGAVAGSGGDFAITSIDLDRELGEVSLTWNSEPGAFYIIESSTNLVDWLEVDDSIPSGGSTTTRSGIPVDSDAPNTTYRIRRQ